MTSIEQVKALLGRGVRDGEQAAALTAAVGREAAAALATATATAHGSRHLKVVEGLDQLNAARAETERLARRLNASLDSAREYRACLG